MQGNIAELKDPINLDEVSVQQWNQVGYISHYLFNLLQAPPLNFFLDSYEYFTL